MSELTDGDLRALMELSNTKGADAVVVERSTLRKLVRELQDLRLATTRIVELTPDNCNHNREIDPDTGECADCGTVLP